jgi:hypothetical protein
MTSLINKKTTPFVLLVLIFIVPMIASWVLFHYYSHFQLKTMNHGTLINPPIHIQNVSLVRGEKKWQVVYVFSHCDQQCHDMQYNLSQIKKALGKESERVDVVWATTNDIRLTNFQNILNQKYQKEFAAGDKIYLIDPLDNLFMYYAHTTDPMNILKDLKKVLEVSQIG